MPKARLTDRKIKSLRAQQGRRLEIWDEVTRGLLLRVNGDGTKVFYLRYRAFGRRRRMKLGAYGVLSLAEARERAGEALKAVSKGEDPQALRLARRAGDGSFRELAEKYLERHAKPHKRSWKEDERKLATDVLPFWADRPAMSIARTDVVRLLDRIADRGAPVAANRTRALLSTVFNFGIKRGLVEANPVHLVDRAAKEEARQRVLTEAEIRAVWEAADEEHPVTAATFKLRLLTAQRGVEVRKMRWSDLDGAWWTIPPEISKNGLAHRVPLSPQALAVANELRKLTGDSEWVCESPVRPGHSVGVLNKARERIRQRSGVDFVPHDLRRTAATMMTGAGITRLVVGQILNHAEAGVTRVYDRSSYDREKRQALDWWGAKVAAIASGEAVSTVVAFPSSAS